MKQPALIWAMLSIASLAFSQQMHIHTDSTVSSFDISLIDSITFSLTSPVSTDSLVGYYPFDGNANDLSASGNNGTPKGGVVWVDDRFGNNGHALSLDGTGWVHVPASPSLDIKTDITIACWIKVPLLTGIQALIYKGSSNSGYDPLLLRLEGTEVVFRRDTASGGPEVRAQISTLDTSHFHFVVATYDHGSGLMSIFVDGDRKVEEIHRGIPNYTTSTMPIDIGAVDDKVFQTLHGAIDDVRIYRRALSDLEIVALYHEGG
jgi:hypothetical protein